jgi:hypothetical protein
MITDVHRSAGLLLFSNLYLAQLDGSKDKASSDDHHAHGNYHSELFCGHFGRFVDRFVHGVSLTPRRCQ